MAWRFIRIALFIAAFLVGMTLTHSEGNQASVPPVLNQSAGAALLVACDDGEVVVTPLRARQDAIQLNCVRSPMVVVRDYTTNPEKIPVFSRIAPQLQ
jgi:hypothetical protein